jgi:endonuclease/exonuclease/phosphatase family metal-dependent hydrolase
VLKFATFNAAGGRYGKERVAETIRAEQPEVVAIQEATEELVDYLTAPEITDLHHSIISWNYGKFGNAILSREPISQAVSQPLYRAPGREQRSLLLGVVNVHGRDILFGSFHLDNDAAGLFGKNRAHERQWQAAQISGLSDIEQFSHMPAIIGGDANSSPGSKEHRLLTGGRLDDVSSKLGGALMTFHGFLNDESMDVIIERGVQPLEEHTLSRGGSDHYLVGARLIVPKS